MIYITHKTKCFIYFYVDNVGVLLLRFGQSPVPKALGYICCITANDISREMQLNLGESLLNEFLMCVYVGVGYERNSLDCLGVYIVVTGSRNYRAHYCLLGHVNP